MSETMTVHPDQDDNEIKRPLGRQIQLLEHGRNGWHVKASYDHTSDDALHPSYLWNLSNQIVVHDVVEIVHVNFKFFIRLYITGKDSDTKSFSFRILEGLDFENLGTHEAIPANNLLNTAVVQHMGNQAKWCVILDREIMSREHPTKEEAEKWLEKKKAA